MEKKIYKVHKELPTGVKTSFPENGGMVNVIFEIDLAYQKKSEM